MKTKVLDTVRKYSMFSSGDKVVVGLSGGADSMCLVSILYDLQSELNISVSAVHINHCIRGEEGDRDERFVRSYCEKKGIPLTVFRKDIPAVATATGESIELAARHIRYECFNECSADKIATAHSASDRTETLLFNLSRGASLKGLCSIPPVRDNIVRPLIAVTRKEIEEYCRQGLIEYITDSTNLTDEYTRNKYRLNVIPALEAVNPAFEKNAVRCIELLNDENAYIERVAKSLFEKNLLPDGRLSVDGLIDEDICIYRRVVLSFLESHSVFEYEFSHLEIITENKGKKFAVCLPGGISVESDGAGLWIKKASDALCRMPLEEYSFRKNDGISFEYGNKLYRVFVSEMYSDDSGIFTADADKVGEKLIFRSRLSGDVIKPGRGRCSKPLRKLFNEIKMPAEDRDFKYILADEDGIVFVEDVGLDARCLCDKNTKKYLIIKTEEIGNEK